MKEISDFSPKNPNFIIFTSPRSGGSYTAKLLTKLGINTGKEIFFDYRKCNNMHLFVGDVSWVGVPYMEKLSPSIKIFHQIRHPMKSIASLDKLNFFNTESPLISSFAQYARKFTYLQSNMSHLEMCIEFVYTWYKLITKNKNRISYTYKVEDLNESSIKFLFSEINGIMPDSIKRSKLKEIISEIPLDINSCQKIKGTKKTDWGSIKKEYKDKIIDICEKQKYKIPDSLGK